MINITIDFDKKKYELNQFVIHILNNIAANQLIIYQEGNYQAILYEDALRMFIESFNQSFCLNFLLRKDLLCMKVEINCSLDQKNVSVWPIFNSENKPNDMSEYILCAIELTDNFAIGSFIAQ